MLSKNSLLIGGSILVIIIIVGIRIGKSRAIKIEKERKKERESRQNYLDNEILELADEYRELYPTPEGSDFYDIADSLLNALSGYTEDEQTVYKLLLKLQNDWEFNLVRAIYRVNNPSFNNLEDDLNNLFSESELNNAQEMLNSNGINFEL